MSQPHEDMQARQRLLDENTALREQLAEANGCESCLIRDRAYECIDMLQAAGFGKPGSPTTLWAMTQAAIGQLATVRADTLAVVKKVVLEHLDSLEHSEYCAGDAAQEHDLAEWRGRKIGIKELWRVVSLRLAAQPEQPKPAEHIADTLNPSRHISDGHRRPEQPKPCGVCGGSRLWCDNCQTYPSLRTRWDENKHCGICMRLLIDKPCPACQQGEQEGER